MITLVSGLPRSGTSLMMQMLAAGGMTLLTDHERKPDMDNPRGYCEWEPIKLLPRDPSLIDQAEGKVVKVITQLLLSIPPGRSYKLIFMERPLSEVLASQDEMIQRRGTKSPVNSVVMANALTDHLRSVTAWLQRRNDIAVYRVAYGKLIGDPKSHARELRDFLGFDLNWEAMAAAVDPSLYRNRQP